MAEGNVEKSGFPQAGISLLKYVMEKGIKGGGRGQMGSKGDSTVEKYE